jgi:hypothetical protein
LSGTFLGHGGTPKMFRVRIGKYPTRREAETIAARLEKRSVQALDN